MPSKKVSSAYVDLELSTAKFRAAINDASGEMRKFSAQMREESNKSRESVRLLSEELGLGIPRGLQGIISKLPGVTTAMNLAFDSVVVFALIGTIVKVTEKVVEFAKKSEEAARKNSESWKEIDKSLRDTNSELARSNAHIQESIAKLEHKPGDGMKNALLEAADAAQKLSEKLDQDLDKLLKLTTERKVGFLDELAGNGQDDLDRTIGYGAKKYREIAPGYDTDRNSAAARGDWKNYNQLGQDELATMHRVLDPQINTLATYLRQHQDLALSNPNDPSFVKAKNGYDTLTGLLSDMALRNQGEQGKQTETGLQFGKDAAAQAKEAEAKAKAEAEARKKVFEEQFGADYARRLPNSAAIMANPGTAGRPGALAQWESGRDKAEYDAIIHQLQDAQKNGLKAQDIAMFKVMLLAIGTKLDIQTAMDTQKVAAANQTSATEFTNTADRIEDEATRKLAESLLQLTAASDKAKESLVKAQVAQNESIDKELLRSGHISPSEYQRRRSAGLKDEWTAKRVENDTEYETSIKKLLADWYNNVTKPLYEAFGKEHPDIKVGTQEYADAWMKIYREKILPLQPAEQQRTDQITATHDIQDRTIKTQAGTSIDEANLAQRRTSVVGQVDSVFDELEARLMDVGKQVHDVFDQALNSFNDAAIKAMTEPDHRGVWKGMGKSIFTDISRTGLQDAEGGIMKALHLGTKVQHVHVDNFPNLSSKAAPGSAVNSAISAATSGSSSGGFWSGLIKGIATFAGAMATGGVMSPGGFYLTGEQGPELLQVGSTSRINNARDTSAILGIGSGGNTHIWQIDAHGSTDPAATRMQVQKGIMAAAPHIIAASHAAQKETQRRTPTASR